MPRFSEEVLEKAKEMTAIEYLKRYEPNRLRKCKYARNEYELTDHDSFKINEITSRWHWKSQDIGGVTALKFLTRVDDMLFRDAVQFLLGECPSYIPQDIPEEQKEKKPFVLPAACYTNCHVRSYLKSRGISDSVIDMCISQGNLYESREYHNAVFIGRDKEGIPRYAFQRGIYSYNGSSFKRDVYGSNKAYGFFIRPLFEAKRVAVYEAAIETMAHMTLEQGKNDKYRLSLGGIAAPAGKEKRWSKPVALEQFLKDHPWIEELEICVNNDAPGRGACKKISEYYKDRYRIIENLPKREGADYADLAKARRKKSRER